MKGVKGSWQDCAGADVPFLVKLSFFPCRQKLKNLSYVIRAGHKIQDKVPLIRIIWRPLNTAGLVYLFLREMKEFNNLREMKDSRISVVRLPCLG